MLLALWWEALQPGAGLQLPVVTWLGGSPPCPATPPLSGSGRVGPTQPGCARPRVQGAAAAAAPHTLSYGSEAVVLLPPSSSAANDSGSLLFLGHAIYPGSPVADSPLASEQECATACRQHPGCNAANFCPRQVASSVAAAPGRKGRPGAENRWFGAWAQEGAERRSAERRLSAAAHLPSHSGACAHAGGVRQQGSQPFSAVPQLPAPTPAGVGGRLHSAAPPGRGGGWVHRR